MVSKIASEPQFARCLCAADASTLRFCLFQGCCSVQMLKASVCTRVPDDASGGADGAGQEKYGGGRDVVKAESPEDSAQAHYKAVTAAAAAAARREQDLRMQVAETPLQCRCTATQMLDAC